MLKALGFREAVNVTLGLPIVRTSVDHGTALDLAAGGNADASSMLHAIEAAISQYPLNPSFITRQVAEGLGTPCLVQNAA